MLFLTQHFTHRINKRICYGIIKLQSDVFWEHYTTSLCWFMWMTVIEDNVWIQSFCFKIYKFKYAILGRFLFLDVSCVFSYHGTRSHFRVMLYILLHFNYNVFLSRYILLWYKSLINTYSINCSWLIGLCKVVFWNLLTWRFFLDVTLNT